MVVVGQIDFQAIQLSWPNLQWKEVCVCVRIKVRKSESRKCVYFTLNGNLICVFFGGIKREPEGI